MGFERDADQRIVLIPFMEIPAREKWLFENKLVLAKITQGLKDAAENKTQDLGSFAKFQDDEID